jgi:two-component system LytT family response regulator
VRALVVDDEAPARRRLVRLLREIAHIDMVEELEDGDAVPRALAGAWPDVLFLDVRMPGIDGIALAQRERELPPIVFVTAHDEYAVRAFDVAAVDYLLKPVRPERLAAAVERVRARELAARGALERALGARRPEPTALPRVVSATRGVIRLFDARTITRFWACDKYTSFRADAEEHLTEESLNALEARLSAYGFVRVHRGELVRADAIRALRVVDGVHEVALCDAQVARVSRRALSAIKSALGL